MFQELDLDRAVVLGALQGVTEFLPISSDGHLAIARHLLGITDGSLQETLLLHLGTLAATLIVLRSEVFRALRDSFASLRTRSLDGDAAKEALAVIVASVPTALVGLGLEDRVERWSDDLRIVGAFLVVSALFVASSHRFRHGESQVLSLRAALLVGVVQGLAVLPGWSRSGSTIATAMALGLAPAAAFRFSFLLSLPAVAGACLLELRHPETWASLGSTAFLGASIAFVVGVVALLLLRGTIARGRFAWFAPYLFVLGLVLALVPLSSPVPR